MKRFFCLILFFGLLYAGCRKPVREAMPTPEIQVATPIVQNVTYTYEYPAYLQAIQSVDLVARIPGFLQEVNYTVGQRVPAGQLLFVIEPKPYADRLNVAQAAVESAKAQLTYAQASYEKMKDAVKSRAVSEIDYIQAESSYHSALAALQNAQAGLNSAQINYDYCYIRAPFNGRVTRNTTDAGNYVGAANTATTLATIYDDRQMYVYFTMPYSEYRELPNIGKSKQPVSILDASDPTAKRSGILDYTAPDVDLNTGTVNVRAIIDNPSHDLLSGTYVTVTVPYKQMDNALLIPEASIGTNQSGRYIYVVGKDNTIVYREVKTGVLENGMREIQNGVSKGEQYVTEALINVRPGMKIVPRLQKPTTPESKH